MEKLKIKVLRDDGAELPLFGSKEAAGADVRANIHQLVYLRPLERKIIRTGLRMEIPKGYEIQVRPRSGLAFKKGLTVLNSPGTIDSDYRGEIKVILINLSNDVVHIEPEERIAQLVVKKVTKVEYEEADVINTTVRGEDGFGSTGTH